MATAIEEDKRAKRTGPAGFAPGVDVAAPLNLTAPGTMRPDAPTPVTTQPAPQFTRTNAGPMLQTPTAPAPAPVAPDPTQQQLANQTAMYVQGAQAAAAARPAPAPAATVAPVAAGMNPAVGASINAAVANPQPALGSTIDTSPRLFDPNTARPMATTAAPAEPAQPSEYGRQMGNVAGFFGDAIKTIVSAPGYGMSKGATVAPPAPASPATPAIAPSQGKASTTTAPASMGDARRAAGDYDRTRVATPPAPPAPPAAPANDFKEVAPGIFRKGNNFSDAAGTQDTAFLNRGAITPQNMQAADNLAANYNTNQQALTRLQAANAASQPQGFNPQQAQQFDRAASIRALNDLRSPEAIALRNLRIDAQEEARDGARMGRAGRGMGQAGQAYAALLGELTTGTRQGQIAEMQDGTTRYTTDVREAGATLRAAMGEQGANTRAGMTNEIQQGELGLKREAQGFTSRAAARLEKAQADYMAADTPEKKAAAAKVIRELQGKEKPESWKAVALQGGTDAQGNRTQSVLAAVNEATGEMRKFKAPVSAAPMPASQAQLESGKVYETNKGPATWDGKNFIPVQQ